MIVTTTRTWCGAKLYLDHKNRVSTDTQLIGVSRSRYDFERLCLFTLEQLTRLVESQKSEFQVSKIR